MFRPDALVINHVIACYVQRAIGTRNPKLSSIPMMYAAVLTARLDV